jgi:hypothetical protein
VVRVIALQGVVRLKTVLSRCHIARLWVVLPFMCPGGPPELDSATTTALWAAEDCGIDTWWLELVHVVMRKVHRWRDEGRRKERRRFVCYDLP